MTTIPRASGIYKIICIPTGKVYVGSAISLSDRRDVHFSTLRSGTHRNGYLQRAWDKYGEASFDFQVIELVLAPFLIEREQYWLDKLGVCNRRKGFNIHPSAASAYGVKRSEEVRRRMSASQIGKKRPNWTYRETPEHREKISAAKKGIATRGAGWQHSEETRKKISQSLYAGTASKKSYVVISPDGDEQLIFGLRAFCREHGLLHYCMTRVADGKQKHHKGWQCKRPK